MAISPSLFLLADRGLDTGRDSLDKEAENRIPD